MSGKLFTLLLAGTLFDVRSRLQRSELPVVPEGFREEEEYVDDVDYMGEAMYELREMLPQVKDLFVNDSKSKYTRVYLADVDEINDKGKKSEKA